MTVEPTQNGMPICAETKLYGLISLYTTGQPVLERTLS